MTSALVLRKNKQGYNDVWGWLVFHFKYCTMVTFNGISANFLSDQGSIDLKIIAHKNAIVVRRVKLENPAFPPTNIGIQILRVLED